MTSPLKLPDGMTLRELGRAENHATLDAVLSKYAFGTFWVTNEEEEEELRAVRRAFDDGVDSRAWGVLHWLLQDGNHEAQFRLLLSLGIDPDKPTKFAYRPSHFTTCYGRPSCARALAPCRPNLAAVDGNGKTPSATEDIVSLNN
jgi:hypothetical protein